MFSFSKAALFASLSILLLVGAGCFEEEGTPIIVDKPKPIYTPAPNTTYYPKPKIAKAPEQAYKAPKPTGDLSGKTIVIDAGHGGKDPGAGKVGYSNTSEKHINLAIAKNLANSLKQKGATVVMTRSKDKFLELEDRASVAQNNDADLFIAIHCDSLPAKPSASGPTIYIADNASWTSRKAALSVSSSMRRWGIEPRGIRRAKYKVLTLHSKPSMLIECGYLTNWQEAKQLGSSWYQEKLAKAIADGVANLY